MNFLKNLFYFVVVVAMLGLGALFAVQNTATVPLDLLVVYLPERSVALWVLLAFAIGGVIGMLTNIGLVLRLRTSLLRANRRLSKLQPSVSPVIEMDSDESTAAPPAAAENTDKTENKEN